MYILMYFKIQSDHPKITQNALKDLICPDNDLVNKLKIRLFKAFCVILG